MDRRKMLKMTGTALLGTALLGPSVFAGEADKTEKKESKKSRKPKALIIGAHPDDPETCCGGTMIQLRKAGYDVVSVYMTKGERGIVGKTLDEAAAIRVPEAKAACEILDVRPIFMTQIDGDAEINKARYVEMRELIAAEAPDIVFTHWPIDSHPDHRVCSLLVYDAWRRLGYNFELFYCEAMSGMQSQCFAPTDWVDISDVAEQKRRACNCHVSQGMDDIYEWHSDMERFRGREFHCDRAEAFVHLRRNNNDLFPSPKEE